MKVLVIGRKGQIARALQSIGSDAFHVTALGSDDMDLAGPIHSGQIASHAPDVIINTAAYTAVELAERESDRAFAINAEGPRQLAMIARSMNVPLIHFSTDYVFDGAQTVPWREEDSPAPINVYGLSKLAGEREIRAVGGNHVILRTSWVYSPWGSNFLRTMLRLATSRPELGIVADQFGTPNSALDLALATRHVAQTLVSGANPDKLPGIYHLSAKAGPINWADFARAIFASSAKLSGPVATVRDITTADYPTPARRPAYSCLDTTKFRTVFQYDLPPWQDGIGPAVQVLKEGNWS